MDEDAEDLTKYIPSIPWPDVTETVVRTVSHFSGMSMYAWTMPVSLPRLRFLEKPYLED